MTCEQIHTLPGLPRVGLTNTILGCIGIVVFFLMLRKLLDETKAYVSHYIPTFEISDTIYFLTYMTNTYSLSFLLYYMSHATSRRQIHPSREKAPLAFYHYIRFLQFATLWAALWSITKVHPLFCSSHCLPLDQYLPDPYLPQSTHPFPFAFAFFFSFHHSVTFSW